MGKINPRPTGKIQGDSRNIPDRGTGTGFEGANPVKLGMDTRSDSTNSLGTFNAKSDSATVAGRQNKGGCCT